MEDNLFSQMIMAMRHDHKAQIPAFYRFGTVISSSPLMVDVAGTVQDESSLLKNSILDGFNAGDLLLLTPIEEEQRYVIICKVVDT